MLTDKHLRNLKPKDKAYKVSDQDGMYVVVSPAGTLSFRYDYRHSGRRETLTLGRYEPHLLSGVSRKPGDVRYGDPLTLADARVLLDRARRAVKLGESPARAKADGKGQQREALTFAAYTDIWLASAGMAESTRAMRKSILDRDILPVFGRRLMEEIKPSELLALCEKIKARGAPAPAVQAREIVGLIYRHSQGRGLTVDNPADKIRPSAIATFKPRERALEPKELGTFFRTLEHVATLPTLRLAVKFMLLTLVRKSEFVLGEWSEVDFEAATWTIPAERMKARRPHIVYLSQQALDILVALKVCAGDSPYLHPSRYRSDQPISNATLNRVIDATVERIRAAGQEFESLSVHDLRRTASTRLHEAGFNSDWIEKCLAHEQKGVRAVYNRAEYSEQRRDMLQQWADMVDSWIKGAEVVPFAMQKAA